MSSHVMNLPPVLTQRADGACDRRKSTNMRGAGMLDDEILLRYLQERICKNQPIDLDCELWKKVRGDHVTRMTHYAAQKPPNGPTTAEVKHNNFKLLRHNEEFLGDKL